jgi:DNA-binding transcriptional ArsR family regulator
MKQKQIGIILIIIGVVLAGFVYATKLREDAHIATMIQIQNGSCYLSDGTCLHDDRDYSIYIIGFALSIALLFFGLYLTFVDKTQQVLEKQSIEVSHALRDAKKFEKEKDEFSAFLSGFTDDEQKILKAVKEQEGILQSTLRYKTGMSKTALSLTLKSLEDREIISRKEAGKTNQVYLRKR